MLLNPEEELLRVLRTEFPSQHITAAVRHFTRAVADYQAGHWDDAVVYAGKFTEATTKALMVHVGRTVPVSTRHFKAGVELEQLRQMPSQHWSETIRLVIPKAGLLLCDIANNRGFRHDSGDIDPTEMDAQLCMSVASWMLAELVRYSGKPQQAEAMAMIEELTKKKYPVFEEIDGRIYVDGRKGLRAKEVALALLYRRYPSRYRKAELTSQVRRHGFSGGNVARAIAEASGLSDETAEGLVLRAHGRDRAESLLAS